MSSTRLPGPRGRSVRFRLTLGNVAALAAVLVLFGLAFRWTLRDLLVRSLDESLEGQVAAVTRRWQALPPALRQALRERIRPAMAAGGDAAVAGALLAEPGIDGGVPSLLFGGGAVPEGVPVYPVRLLDREGRTLLSGAKASPWSADCFRRSLAGDVCHATTAVAAPGGAGPDRVRVCSVPVRTAKGSVEGVVQLARSLRPTEETLAQADRALLLFLPLSLLAAGVVGALLADRALRPVGRISEAAARIGAEDLSRRLPAAGADEFAALATVINGMLTRLERAFEQQRRFTADASHELRSPLTVILGQASLALSSPDVSGEEGRRGWERTARAARSMERLVADLLTLARADARQWEMERTTVRLRELLRAAADSVPAGGPAVSVACPDDLTLEADAAQLERAVHNLLTNAVRHTPPSGSVAVSADVAADGDVLVKVADTGSGVAPEDLPHLGERFYRADRGRSRAAGGTGLGLAITRSIAEAHGGTLAIESEWDRGTTATIRLPRRTAAPDTAAG